MKAEERKYPTSELEVLENGVKEVVEPSGLKLVLKPVPGEDREHVLDPRVYARAHASSLRLLRRDRHRQDRWT